MAITGKLVVEFGFVLLVLVAGSHALGFSGFRNAATGYYNDDLDSWDDIWDSFYYDYSENYTSNYTSFNDSYYGYGYDNYSDYWQIMLEAMERRTILQSYYSGDASGPEYAALFEASLNRALGDAVRRDVLLEPERPLCHHGTVYCIAAGRCVPMDESRCSQHSSAEAGEPRVSLDLVHAELVKAVQPHTRRLSTEKLCAGNAVYCIAAGRCVRLDESHCSQNPSAGAGELQLSLDLVHAELVKALYPYKHHLSTEELCTGNSVLCVESLRCVPAGGCKDRMDGGPDHTDGPDDTDGPGDRGEPDNAYGPDDSNFFSAENIVAYLNEDLQKALQGTTNEGYHPTDFCQPGFVYCISMDQCVPSQCTRSERSEGECPAEALEDEDCTEEMKCSEDSHCSGLTTKCCKNACLGSACYRPSFKDVIGGSDQPEIKPYLVTSLKNELEMKAISIQERFLRQAADSSKFRFNMTESSGNCTWSYQTGVEQEITGGEAIERIVWANLTSERIVAAKDTITCIPHNMTVHGLTKVNISEVNARGQVIENYTLAVLILPAQLLPTITLKSSTTSTTLTYEEDEDADITLPVNITSTMNLDMPPLTSADIRGLTSNDAALVIFNEYTKRLNLARERAKNLGIHLSFPVRPANGEKPAELLIFVPDEDDPKFQPVKYGNGTYGDLNRPVKLRPTPNWFGTFDVTVRGCNGLNRYLDAPRVSEQGITFTIVIESRNDAPHFRPGVQGKLSFSPADVFRRYLVPIDPEENEGSLVSELVGMHFEDPESDSLGILVIRAQNLDLGSWQYLPNGATDWIEIDMDDVADLFDNGIFPPFSPASLIAESDLGNAENLLKAARNGEDINLRTVTGQGLLLAPTTRVRYLPSSLDAFWDYNSDTKVAYTAWDIDADETNSEGDMVDIQLPFCVDCAAEESLFALGYLVGDAMRMGCHGHVSTVSMVFDDCGVCAGDGRSCRDCTDTKNGTAFVNRCGNCVGGTSGNAVDAGVDCEGQCSVDRVKTYTELDGDCLRVGIDTAAVILENFCDGVWKSTAKIDRCGNCVLGNTDKLPDYAVDECGLCDGDDSTCVDCAGVPNGPNKLDGCGACLNPGDPNWDSGCVSITTIEPEYSLVGSSGMILVKGAGLDLYGDEVTCSMVHDVTGESNDFEDVEFFKHRSIVRATYPAVQDAGSYNVECKFTKADGSIDTKMVEETKFQYLAEATLTRLVPSSANLGEVPLEVFVVGSDFIDTGEVSCYFICPYTFVSACRWGPVTLPAVVVNSTHVKCMVPEDINDGIRTGISLNISVAMTVEELFEPNLEAASVTFDISSPAPVLKKAGFVGACTVLIWFDLSINEISACSDALDSASVNKLGTEPECAVIGNKLRIALGDGPTLEGGQSITLKANAIYQRGADNAQYAAGSVDVETPSTKSVFPAGFFAPEKIGNCDSQEIRAVFQGARCGVSSMQYTWNATIISSANMAEAEENLEDLKVRLATINSDTLVLNGSVPEISPGSTYEFTVSVIDHLGIQSDSQIRQITRADSAQAILVDIGVDRDDWNPERDLIIQARVSLSDCAGITLDNLAYNWEAEGITDFNLGDFSNKVARIKGGDMKGGKTYPIKVILSATNNADVRAEASITVTTRSQELIPFIKGYPVINTGVSNDLELDASLSRDPDGADGITYYTWSCSRVVEENGTRDELPCMITIGEEVTKFEQWNVVANGAIKFTIPADSLVSNSQYEFTLTMALGERRSTISVEVNVAEGQPPTVQIDPLPSKFVPTDTLRIKAAVSSPLPVTCVWRADQLDGYEPLEFDEENDKFTWTSTGPVKGYSCPLVIQPNSLKPGGLYKFILEASHADSGSLAEIDVQVNAPPQNCYVELSGTTGVVLTDDFAITISGCEDDEDDFPLVYDYLIDSEVNGLQRQIPRPISNNEFSVALSAGVHRFVVDACDQYSGCIRLTSEEITVTKVDLDLDSLEERIKEERKTGGSSFVQNAIAELVKDGSSDEEKALGVAEASNEAKSAFASANPDQGEFAVESAKPGVNVLKAGESVINGTVTSPVDNELQGTLISFPDSAARIILTGTTSGDTSAGVSRKKRAVADGSVIAAIDVDTATSLMEMVTLAMQSVEEAEISLEDAQAFINTLEAVWQGMCAGVVSGQDPVMGYTASTVFTVYSVPFEGLNGTTLYVSCANLSCEYSETPATYTLSNDLVALYSEWSCDADTTCYGACLATGQLEQNVITALSDELEPLDSARFSDIVAINVINPVSATYETHVNLADPIRITIQLTAVPDISTYLYMCRAWNLTDLDWTNDACSPAILSTPDSGSTWVANCECYQTGYFAVFEGDPLASEEDLFKTTTNAALIGIVESTTPVPPPISGDLSKVKSVTIVFSIDATFASVVTNETSVILQLTAEIAGIMNVEESRITNMELRSGSIIVAFDLLPGTVDGDTDFNDAITALQDRIDNSYSLTIDGSTYNSVPNSMEYTAVKENLFDDAGNKGMGLGPIIGAVVGGSLVMILGVVIIACVIVKKKTGGNKVEHSPRGSHMELGENYQIKPHKFSPEEEALYGPAPIPTQPSRHSRPSSRNSPMTPVS